MNSILHSITTMGPVVLLPIVMFILSIIFGMRLGKAVLAGLMVGIGFSGLSVIISLLMTTVTPAVSYYKSMNSGRFTAIDVGWAAVGAGSWGVSFAALAVLINVFVNILMIILKWTDILNVDIWNYIHFLIPGALAYALWGNFWLGLGVTVVLSAIDLLIAPHVAHDWQEHFALAGTTCSTFSYISFAWPVARVLNWVIERIPGLRSLDISVEKLGRRFGALGDNAVIGAIVGVFLGLLTRQSWQGVLIMAMGIAAALVLLPQMVNVMMEGLSAVSEGAQNFAKKRIGSGRQLLVGMDVGLGLKDPNVVTVSVILIPVAILFAFIIPGMTFFPVGLLTGIVFMLPMISMVTKGNVVRTLIIGAIFMFGVMWMTSIFTPEATAMMHTTGVGVTGSVTDTFFGYNIANVLICLIHRIIG